MINDGLKALRQQVLERAQTLQKYIHFECAMSPHLEKLADDISKLTQVCNEREAEIAKMEESSKQEEIKRQDAEVPILTDEERRSKIEEIKVLEDEYSALLEEKAQLLSQSDEL